MKTEDIPKRIIIIDNCIHCPLILKCRVWKKLSPKQKFTLKFGQGVGKFILKGCPLKEYKKTMV